MSLGDLEVQYKTNRNRIEQAIGQLQMEFADLAKVEEAMKAAEKAKNETA